MVILRSTDLVCVVLTGRMKLFTQTSDLVKMILNTGRYTCIGTSFHKTLQ